jgi:hypothetical protein
MADRVRLVGAVNGVLATGKRHGGDAHWIARRTAGDHLRQMGLVTPHLGRRRPSRVRVLAADVGRPRPLLADPANSNRIADGLAGSGHVIEPPLLGADDDRARSDRLLHRHHAPRACAASTVAKPAAPTAATRIANRVFFTASP